METDKSFVNPDYFVLHSLLKDMDFKTAQNMSDEKDCLKDRKKLKREEPRFFIFPFWFKTEEGRRCI